VAGIGILASLIVPATMFAADEPSAPGEQTPPAAVPTQPDPAPSPGQPVPPDQGSDGTVDPSQPQADPPEQSSGSNARPSPRPSTFRSLAAAKATSVSIVGDVPSAFAYTPKSVTVHVGDTVRWTNDSSVSEGHTVTANTFDSGTMNDGDDYSHTFSRAGKFQYFCAFHGNMKGNVTVLASGSGGGGGGGGSSSGDPGGGGNGGSTSSGGSSSGSTAGSGTGSSAGATGGSGQLPLTGLPLLPLGAIGAGLLAVGGLLWRRAYG
jgi:plastocyanin